MIRRLSDRAKIFASVSFLILGVMMFTAADGLGPSSVSASCGEQVCPPGTTCCGSTCISPPMLCCGMISYNPDTHCCIP